VTKGRRRLAFEFVDMSNQRVSATVVAAIAKRCAP